MDNSDSYKEKNHFTISFLNWWVCIICGFNFCFFLFPFLEIIPGIDYIRIDLLTWFFGAIELVLIGAMAIVFLVSLCYRGHGRNFVNRFKYEWHTIKFWVIQTLYAIFVFILLVQYISDNKLYSETKILDEINALQSNESVGRFNIMETRFVVAIFFTAISSLMVFFIALKQIQIYHYENKKLEDFDQNAQSL